MISPQGHCLFSCVSSTRSAHKKPFHCNKTDLCVYVCARVCANVCVCMCRAHRASESLRDHLFVHSRRLSGPAACVSHAVGGRKSQESVLMQSMLQARGFAVAVGTKRVVTSSRTPARLHTHAHTQIHQKRLHSSHSSYKDECSQLSHQLQLQLQRTHVSAVHGFDYFSHFFHEHVET